MASHCSDSVHLGLLRTLLLSIFLSGMCCPILIQHGLLAVTHHCYFAISYLFINYVSHWKTWCSEEGWLSSLNTSD
jgi:hypothetical protein